MRDELEDGDTVAVRDEELDLEDVDEAKADNVDELDFETVGVGVDVLVEEMVPVEEPEAFEDLVAETVPVPDLEEEGERVPTGDLEDDGVTVTDEEDEEVTEDDLEGNEDREEEADAPDDRVPDEVFEADMDASGVLVALVVLVDDDEEPLDLVPEGVLDEDVEGRDDLEGVLDIVDVFVEVPDRDAVPVRLFVEVGVRVRLALGTISRPPASRRANPVLSLLSLLSSSSSSLTSSSSCLFIVCNDPRTRRPFRSRFFQK